MNQPQNKIESAVMDKINGGKVHLRSKYIFLAEKLGLGSAFVLTVLLAVLFFNLALFYLRASDNLAYLSFGSQGFLAFLESFPYLLIVALVLLVFVAGWLIKKSGISYKKPFVYLAAGLIGVVVVGGIVLAYTNIAENIEQQTFESPSSNFFFKPFLMYALEAHQRGIVGRVVESGEGYISIQTPKALEKIILTTDTELPKEPLTDGVFVMAVGTRDDGNFTASKLRIINEQDMQMIRRGIHRRFGQLQSHRNLNGGCNISSTTPNPTTTTCF